MATGNPIRSVVVSVVEPDPSTAAALMEAEGVRSTHDRLVILPDQSHVPMGAADHLVLGWHLRGKVSSPRGRRCDLVLECNRRTDGVGGGSDPRVEWNWTKVSPLSPGLGTGSAPG